MSRVRRISYAISKDGRRSTAIQQAIRIRDLALSIVEEANFSAQRTRRVTKKAAFTVVLRSLQQSHDMPFSLREHLAIKELNHYISLAQTNKLNSLTLSHTDLLPISHPRSTREHSMTASGLREANSRWYADDSRITDERARSILASAYSAKFGSVEHTYFTSLLSGLPQGSIPGEALIAAFGDGNSSAARSERAMRQRRDRKGQFAFEGGGLRALIRRLDKKVFGFTGRTVAQGTNDDAIQIELPDGRIAQIPVSKGEFVRAVLPTPDGYSPKEVVPLASDDVIDEKDIVYSDAPNGWEKDENWIGDSVRFTDGAFDVYVSKDINGNKKYKLTNTDTADEIATLDTWADVQDTLRDNEDALAKPKARLDANKKENKKADADFEFNYPDGAYKIAPNVSYDPQGRVDEESSDYTDDYVELAQNQDERDLIVGLEQAVVPQEGGGAALGNGALAFNKGDEWVPAEAIYLAINEAGGDAEMELAKIYDKILGGSDNQDALNDFRKKSESVTGETPRLDKAFERVAGKDSGEDVLPATEEPAFDPAEMDKVPLPPLLEGLSEEEISDYQKTKDHTPYLPKNEDIDMPVGYKKLSPEPYKSWREVTKDNPEESFPVGWSDNPFYLAQSIDTEPLETELRRSIEPGNEIPGAALISLPTEDGEDFTAHVPGEAVRDALQLQGVDTNKIIKDIAAEGFIGQKDEDIAQVPEGINKKGADPIAEGWTSSDWLNEDGSTEFHDLIKANEDFTRLAGFYNDAKIDSPLMSDYQEKDMLGNLGIDATDEINAIDKGLKFEAGPSAKVGYALNLLDNPDFSSNPDFKKDANGERSDTTKIEILKSADENLASAVADLKADSPEVNAINSVRKSIADQIASLNVAAPETPEDIKPTEVSDKEIFERRQAGESLQDVADSLGIPRLEVRKRESRYIAENPELRIKKPAIPEAPEKDITGYKVVASGADKVDANGTSLQGNISATRKELEAIFGKPDTYEDDKVKVSWSLEFEGPDGTEIATIYDWKNDSAPGDDEVYDWHIGGNNPLAVDLVKNAFNPPEDIKPIELTPESKYADLVFDGDVSLEDQIKNAIEKGNRIGFFYNGSQRLVSPVSIYTNPKNGNVNVRVLDENGDHKTFTIGNMEDGKDRSDLSVEDQRGLESDEWVEANAGRLAGTLPEDIKIGDYLDSKFYGVYLKAVSEAVFLPDSIRYVFDAYNPKNRQIELVYYEPKTKIRNARRLGVSQVPEDYVFPKNAKGTGEGPKRGVGKRKSLDEPVFAREGREMGGSNKKREKQSKYEDRSGTSLVPGDVVRHYDPKKNATLGRGIVKLRIGAQITEAGKVGGISRKGKVYLGQLAIQWENEDATWAIAQGYRTATSGHLVIQEGDNSDIQLPDFRGGRTFPNKGRSVAPTSEKLVEDKQVVEKEGIPASMDVPTENVTINQFSESTLGTSEKIDPDTEKVANSIIEALERGTAPWRKPWVGGGFLPTSVATGKTYEGSNVLILWAAQEKNEWTDNRWLTYKQAEKLKGNIKRGEKGTQIIHWQPTFKDVEQPDGTKEKVFVYRPPSVITVFNVEQAENIDIPDLVKAEPVPVTEAETTILEAYKDRPEIKNVAQDRAFYDPNVDVIKLPQRGQFSSPKDYFETLVHELAHSTGHKTRLNRSNLLDNYGSHLQSRGEEELIAEIAVSIAAARLGVEIDFGNIASYAQSWLGPLKNDKTMIVKAAKQAQKAVDHMLGKQEEPAKVDENNKSASSFPGLSDYSDGGSGGLVGSRSTVGFVSTDALKDMAGNATDNKVAIESYRKSLREGKGFAITDFDGKPFNDPIMVVYDNETGLAFVGEGNHRLQAAIAENIPYVPVRVVNGRAGEMFEDAGRGRFPKQIKNNKEPKFVETVGPTSGQPVGKGYVPPEMHPSYVFDKEFISDEVPDFVAKSDPFASPESQPEPVVDNTPDVAPTIKESTPAVEPDVTPEVNSRGYLRSKIKATDLKVGDRLDPAGKVRVSTPVRTRENGGSMVGTRTRGSGSGGLAVFEKDQEISVWRKPETSPAPAEDNVGSDGRTGEKISNDAVPTPNSTPEPSVGEQGKTGEEIAREDEIKPAGEKGGHGLSTREVYNRQRGRADVGVREVYDAEEVWTPQQQRPMKKPVAPKRADFQDRESYIAAHKKYSKDFDDAYRESSRYIESSVGEEHLDGSAKGVQKYVRDIITANWFVEAFGDGGQMRRPPVTLFTSKKRGGKYSYGFKNGAWISSLKINSLLSKNEPSILHEIAHFATAISVAKAFDPHGVEYRMNLIFITNKVLGRKIAEDLKDAYRKGNLNVG